MALVKAQAVNINRPPYSTRLKLSEGQFISGEAVFLDKELADSMLLIAEQEKGNIYLNSAYRTPNRLTTDSTSHTGLMAVDIQTIVYDNEEGNAQARQRASDESTVRRVGIVAKYATGSEAILDSGAKKFNTPGRKYKYSAMHTTVIDTKTNTEIPISPKTAENINRAELQHLQTKKHSQIAGGVVVDNSKTLTTLLSDSMSDGDKYIKNGALVEAVAPDGRTGKVAMNVVDRFEYTVDDETGRIDPESPITYIASSPAVNPIDKKDYVELGKNFKLKDLAVTIKGGTPSPVRIGANGPKSDAMLTSHGYDPDSAESYRYIARTELPELNDDRSISAGELGAGGAIGDKKCNNVISGHNAYGTLAKYKDSEQPAVIRLVQDAMFAGERDALAVEEWKAWEASGVTYVDQFVMERVSNQSRETYQVIASLGDEYKVYFGTSSPEVMSISGYTLNYVNQQWLYDFKTFYHRYLKGSKVVENRLRAFLTYTDSIYEVLLTSFAYSETSKIPGAVTISLECIVLQWIPFGDYQDPISRSRKQVTPPAVNYSGAQMALSEVAKDVLNRYQTLLSQGAGALTNYKRLIDQMLMQNTAENTRIPKDIIINETPPPATPSSQDKLAAQIADAQQDPVVSVLPGTVSSIDMGGAEIRNDPNDQFAVERVQAPYANRHLQ